jgi:hypothetical protein
LLHDSDSPASSSSTAARMINKHTVLAVATGGAEMGEKAFAGNTDTSRG